MVKTIKQLADELKVSKQTIQYHYQRLPAKNQQKDSQGKNLIGPLAESLIKDRMSKPLLAKNHQNDSKEPTKASKEENDLITTLRREVRDLKSERDKQLATKDQQISNKDRQIDYLTKLIDQQQQLQLAADTKNRSLEMRVQKLRKLIENYNHKKEQQTNSNEGSPNTHNPNNIIKNKIPETNKSNKQVNGEKSSNYWWHFWKKFLTNKIK